MVGRNLSVGGDLSVTGDAPYTPRHLRYYFTQKTTNAGTLTSGGGGLNFSTEGTGSDLTDATGSYALYTSVATTNNNGGTYTVNANIQTRHYGDIIMVVHTNAAAQASFRLWAGFSSASPIGGDDPAAHLAAFRVSTTAGDVNWMACVKDNVTLSCVSSGVAYADNSRYVLRIRTTPTTIYFYINDALVRTATANLPGSDQNLQIYCSIRTLENVAKAIGIALVGVEVR